MRGPALIVLLEILIDIQGAGSMSGGILIRPHEFPYAATIWIGGITLCSGVIFKDTHILTLASCVKGKNPLLLHVLVGANHLDDDNAVRLEVERIEAYSGFGREHVDNRFKTMSGDRNWNDIAFVIVSRHLEWNNVVNKAPVRHIPLYDSNCECYVYGWGLENADDDDISLRRVSVVVSDRENCATLGWKLTDDELCAADLRSSVELDKFDSGSAVFCDEQLVGLVSAPVPDVDTFDTEHTFPIKILSPHLYFIYGAINGFIKPRGNLLEPPADIQWRF